MRKKPWTGPPVPGAAGGTVFRIGPGFKTVSLTNGTSLQAGDFQFHFFALGRFHESYGEIITRSAPSLALVAPPRPLRRTRKKSSKISPKLEKISSKPPKAAETGYFSTFVAESIIEVPLFLVMEDLIGFSRFFKAFFGLFISRIPVRVILQGHFPVGFLDFLFIRPRGTPNTS